MTSETNNKPGTMKGECYMDNNNLILTATSFELSLTPGHPVILWNPDAFNDFALIECKTKRTHITLLADTKDLENFDSKVIRAFKDEKAPTFSIDNTVLNSILNHSTSIMENLITLLSYHEEISQESVDVLMQKISDLSRVYSPEYIITEITKMSESGFESFLEADNTFAFFQNSCRSDSDEF